MNSDSIPDYFTRNITHRYHTSGQYLINLAISNGTHTHSTTRTCIIPSGKPERDCFLYISSIPPKADIWVDNTDKIGMTTPNILTGYLVPDGTHTISLRKDGYETWTGSYSLKWPQVRYFGQINLKPVQKLSSEPNIDSRGAEKKVLMTGFSATNHHFTDYPKIIR